MSHFRSTSSCRICRSRNLVEVMSFGSQYIASNFVSSNADPRISNLRIPITVLLCKECSLVQLKETVDRELLYRDYFYRSGTNPVMREDLKDLIDDLLTRVDVAPGDLALDIGCNDCTMLSYLPKELLRVGIDPAKNIDWRDVDPSIRLINDFFSRDVALKASEGQRFKIVTSVAMFYDLDDPNAVVSDVKNILSPEGVWCIQLTYLPALIQNMNFYDICHEHLLYYSLRTLNFLMERNGLTIFDASTNEVNGGSLRVFVTHQEARRPTTARFKQLLEEESALKLEVDATYQEFFVKIMALRDKVVACLRQETASGRLVIGLGASTKGNVLLQLFGIDKTLLPYISERNPEKVSLRTLGTDIELISEERARQMHPSCMLVLIWFFKEEIVRRERDYLEQGGKLLFPMPYCHVISRDGERRL